MPESLPPTMTLPPRPTSDDEPERVALDEPSAPEAGDRYAVERPLGQGGMGTVTLVRDQVVGRHVALKQLNAHHRGDPTARARFAREARLQGQLEHPAIVPVYDVGTSPDDEPYFTMKRVRGQSLGEVLRHLATGEETRFTRRKLLTAFSQLCAAVHYAHERGVVHRDIKPGNVMLGPYGEVYLLDWGLAKVGGDTSDDAPIPGSPDPETPALTGAGSIMGTPSTMAPEQAVGGQVDARADVYALGAILFEILTLQPLHPVGPYEAVLAKVVEGVDARPSVRAPAAEVPPELEALCVAATRRDPADRLSSALAMHEAVEAYLDGDRDLQARRESARRHREAAREAALSDDEHGRATALREIGRALALDPDDKEALATFVRLLTTPPKTPPRELVEEQRAARDLDVRRGGIAGAVVYGFISLNAFSTWQLGVRDVASFTTAHVLWGCAFLTSLATIWRPTYARLFLTYLFGVSTCVFITNVYSPFVLVPTLLSMHAVMFALMSHRSLRIAVIVTSCLAWTVSVFGEMGGLLADSARFVDGDLVVHSPVIALPEKQATLHLYVAMLGALIGPPAVVGALRAAWSRSDADVRMQAWQLRQLVSTGAAEPLQRAE